MTSTPFPGDSVPAMPHLRLDLGSLGALSLRIISILSPHPNPLPRERELLVIKLKMDSVL